MRNMIFLVIIIVFIFISGCASTPNHMISTDPNVECQMKDYGNGVLYFECVDSQFAASLSKYISNNPNITIQSISGTNQDFYGEDHGYIVVIKNEL